MIDDRADGRCSSLELSRFIGGASGARAAADDDDVDDDDRACDVAARAAVFCI